MENIKMGKNENGIKAENMFLDDFPMLHFLAIKEFFFSVVVKLHDKQISKKCCEKSAKNNSGNPQLLFLHPTKSTTVYYIPL